MNKEEKESTKLETLIELLYTDRLSQYGKRKLVNYIEKQQKEIKKEKNRIMELAELLDKQENEIKFLKGELEIQEGCYISKDKIREIRDKAEVMDYYTLNDVIDDLSKLIGDYEEDE